MYRDLFLLHFKVNLKQIYKPFSDSFHSDYSPKMYYFAVTDVRFTLEMKLA